MEVLQRRSGFTLTKNTPKKGRQVKKHVLKRGRGGGSLERKRGGESKTGKKKKERKERHSSVPLQGNWGWRQESEQD